MAALSVAPVSRIAPDNDIVNAEVFIAAPRERVFEALTDPKQAARWWGAADRYHMAEFQMDVRVGGKWSTKGTSAKMGAVTVHGEFVEIDPPRRLSYTWVSSWMPRNTTVLWELEHQSNGTLVKLTHRGFAGNAEQAQNHSIGWTMVLGWLQAYAEGGETVDNRR
jgi:uncharacterized protein YndB with AHSA1/START domain